MNYSSMSSSSPNNDTSPSMVIYASTRPSRNGKYSYQLLTGNPEEDRFQFNFIMYQDESALYTIKGTQLSPGLWYREVEWKDLTGVFYRNKHSIIIGGDSSGEVIVDFDKEQIIQALRREIENRKLDANRMRGDNRPQCTVKYRFESRVEFSISFKVFQKRECEIYVAQRKVVEQGSLELIKRDLATVIIPLSLETRLSEQVYQPMAETDYMDHLVLLDDFK
eukprot:TRINITY_DN839_c0_g1_i1.p1 TRINITY_DN839_c0_g1~~TRINITY_DN839_c0_g1_i1.p1  ORF type:complete len:222 (+),score=27.77 TRINITY_DN839_c0_g1_i1:165-830(+)